MRCPAYFLNAASMACALTVMPHPSTLGALSAVRIHGVPATTKDVSVCVMSLTLGTLLSPPCQPPPSLHPSPQVVWNHLQHLYVQKKLRLPPLCSSYWWGQDTALYQVTMPSLVVPRELSVPGIPGVSGTPRTHFGSGMVCELQGYTHLGLQGGRAFLCKVWKERKASHLHI